MPKVVPARPQQLRVMQTGRIVGVDRTNKVLRGMVVAQVGPFKSEGRGEFDETSLRQIVDMWPKKFGLKSRFAHPNESGDGIGKFLGRVRDPWIGKAVVERDGQEVEVQAVRADLYLDPSAFSSPSGNLGDYLLDLAESDPVALSSSLVLARDESWRKDEDGNILPEMPPLWRVTKLYASDLVDEGDAVDGLLSREKLRYTRDYLQAGEEILDEMFPGQPRQVVRARLQSYLNRYLDHRFGSLCMRNYKQLGATLSGVLNDYIDAMVTAEMPREVIVGNMAAAAEQTVEEAAAIIAGTAEPSEASVLEAYSMVLACPLGELVTAAEADGTVFGQMPEESESSDVPVEAPASSDQAMMRKVSVLKKLLDLKEKMYR